MKIEHDDIWGDYVAEPQELVDYYDTQKTLPNTGLQPYSFGASSLFSARRLGEGAEVLNTLVLTPASDDGNPASLRTVAAQLAAITGAKPALDDCSHDDVDPAIYIGRTLDDMTCDADYNIDTALAKIIAAEQEVVAFITRPDVQQLLRGKVRLSLAGPQVLL